MMVGNNITRQNAHRLIHKLSNLLSAYGQLTIILGSDVIVLRQVDPVRRCRLAAGLKVQHAEHDVVFL